jgi:hypothetical protein
VPGGVFWRHRRRENGCPGGVAFRAAPDAGLPPVRSARAASNTTDHHLPPRPSESANVPHRVRSMSSPRLVDVDLIRDLLEPLGDSAQCATPLTWDYLRLMSTPNHRRHFGALGATASGIKVSSGGRELLSGIDSGTTLSLGGSPIHVMSPPTSSPAMPAGT